MGSDVFLSYASADRKAAKTIASQLREAGLRVWDPHAEILPGENWAAKTGEALENADALVVLLSRSALQSESVTREVAYALGSPRFKDRVISVKLGKTPEAPFLRVIQPVELKARVNLGKRVANVIKRAPLRRGATESARTRRKAR